MQLIIYKRVDGKKRNGHPGSGCHTAQNVVVNRVVTSQHNSGRRGRRFSMPALGF